MALNDIYIVNFTEAIALFRRRIAQDGIPTIDVDQVTWRTMEAFHHVAPISCLIEIANEMVSSDYLYSKLDFSDVIFDETFANKPALDRYLRDCIVELGNNMYAKLMETGMLRRGTERYTVVGPMDNETYTLRQTGH